MARYQRASLIDIEELEALADAAERGNEVAADRLRDLNRTYSHRASQRMRELKSKNLDTKALQYAQYYLDERGRKYFGAGRGADLDEIVENLEQARKFLSWQTSTVGGERARVDKILDTLQEHGYIDEFKSESDRKTFLKFLESDAFTDFKKAVDSGIITDAQNAIEHGRSLEDLQQVYSEYKVANMDAIKYWEKWSKIKT